MPAFNFASFGVALIAVLMLLFGMVLGTKIGSELAKNCINHKDYWIAPVSYTHLTLPTNREV